jgi:uncharacterized protein
MDVWRRDDHRQMPWKNGGGLTREVASSPPGSALTDFDWRISFAEVAAGGPFSTFPGVDRVIILVDGPAMALTVDGVRHELERHRPFAFDGTSPTTCEIPAGPTRDLNVMTRRERIRAEVEVLEPATTEQVAVESGTELVLVAITGHVLVTSPAGEPTTLEAMDGLRWNECAPLTLAGPGSLAAVRLTRPSSGRH